MKSLFAPYLSLMHAFKIRADERIGQLKELKYYSNIDLLREYGTLRLDGGRQSGKTKAVAEFAADWIADGGCVWVLGHRMRNAEDTAKRIRGSFTEFYHGEIQQESIICDTGRSFIGSGGCKARGRTLNRILYIIEEPMTSPNMVKYYEAHFDGPFYACITKATMDGKESLPLFFVIGMQ